MLSAAAAKLQLLGLWLLSLKASSPPPSNLHALPTPPAPQNVIYQTLSLTDQSRTDPFAPPNTPRRLMLSIFIPAFCFPSSLVETQYMPNRIASVYDAQLAQLGVPNGTFASFHLQTCPSRKKLTRRPYPLLIFSPGFGSSRLLYSNILQWISSAGYTIISIDHPHDTDIEYPDGSLVPGNITDESQIPLAVTERVGDVNFILESLSKKPLSDVLPPRPSKNNGIGVFGHSLGGATAANVLLTPNIPLAGGLNMDGSMFSPSMNKSDSKPFLLFAATGHNQSESSDPTWYPFWQQLKGTKFQLEVADTQHLSFSDFPILAETVGVDPKLIKVIGDAIGTIEGKRMLQILRSYVSAFFDFALKGSKEGVLSGPSKSFPEVAFMNVSRSG
jgi:pimeloyl-ACP methyl ester carboxylesterase